jgi:hypothetical protein
MLLLFIFDITAYFSSVTAKYLMYITGDHFTYLMAGLSSMQSKACFMATAAILDVPNIVPQVSGTQNVSIGVLKVAHLVVVDHITVTCSICLYSIFIIKKKYIYNRWQY